ncbi:MAG: hypothetical protein HYY41_06645 [Chloroflexi bacterium]|nr:hypothetical protein [Chloroflexota bacterium]
MPKKTLTVTCPFCRNVFSVAIDSKYKGAEAIPQGGNLPKGNGHNQPCPNSGCEQQLFIRYIK